RIDGVPNTTPFPKDGINDHVVHGADAVNPAMTGTKAAAWYQVTVAPGDTAEIRLRLRQHAKPESVTAESGNGATRTATTASAGGAEAPLGLAFAATMATRLAEADEFYAELRRDGATDDEQMIMRQAFAGMLWCKQYYGYNVARWLDGD